MSASKHPDDGGRVERREEDREGGQRDDLRGEEEGERRDRLAEPDGAPIAGRQHEPVEDAVLLLGHPRTREPEQRREDDRDPEQPVRRIVLRVGRKREAEDDERREDEQQHRRERVARPELDLEVLRARAP